MKDRIALIWFSCFCWASAILKVMSRFLASALETEVSAARQPDSEPICEKPMVRSAAWAPRVEASVDATVAARRALNFMWRFPQRIQTAALLRARCGDTPSMAHRRAFE